MPVRTVNETAAIAAAAQFLDSLGVLGDSEAVGDQVGNLVRRAVAIAKGDEEVPQDLLS